MRKLMTGNWPVLGLPWLTGSDDAPCRPAIEQFGDVVAYPILGGLHHRYARI
jgi:hypothetical protein